MFDTKQIIGSQIEFFVIEFNIIKYNKKLNSDTLYIFFAAI